MPQDYQIVQEYDEYYNEAYYAWNPFFPLADRDLRFYLGDQWDEKEKQLLFEEGRNQFVYNKIRRNINLLTGYQRKNRLSSVVVPVENSDQQTADQLTKVLLYVMQYGDGYRVISDCFGGGLKTGFNLCNLWLDYRDDPINGDIRFSRTPYSGFICDPYFTELSWSDCSYVIKRKYLSKEQTASLLPGQEKEVYELHKIGWSRDDKFTWLPYQRQPNGQELLAYNEYYKIGWRNEPMLVDTQTGEYTPWPGEVELARRFTKYYPQLQIVERPTKYIETHIIVNDHYMRTEENQFGLQDYPFVPFVGIWEPESDFWGLKMQSLIRCQIDPQREMNRRISQMTDILDSQINSGWIADEDSVINPRSLYQTSQGKTVWRKKDAKPGAIEKIPPAQIPPSMFQLQELFDRSMMEILGVNDASFGVPDSGNESGIMMMLRQGSSIVNLQDVFDNLRFSQKCLSLKALKIIQTWTPEKIKRIINEEPTQQFYNRDFTKYDIAVQEGMLTDTQRQMYFRQLVDLKQLGVPVSGAMLAEAAPIQGKTEYVQQLKQEEQAQAQQMQQQAQMQQQLLDSQRQLAQAKSISDIALSKERFTRAVANMGLEDERAARAVDDRASASLDRARAMKELASLDDDRLIKYLSIVRQLEEFNRAKEEQIKEDDVAISARGAEGAQAIALAEQTPAVGEEFAEEQVTQTPVEAI